MYQYIYQCVIRSHVMILFQSCPMHFIGIAGASVLNVPRTGSNSRLRATRWKCARISFLVQGVFPRDTFTTLTLVILFPRLSFPLSHSFLSFFDRATIDHFSHTILSHNFTKRIECKPCVYLNSIDHIDEIIFVYNWRYLCITQLQWIE